MGNNKGLRRPRITAKVLDGIITATSAAEAGGFQEGGDIPPEDAGAVLAAQKWAWDMRAWLASRRT